MATRRYLIDPGIRPALTPSLPGLIVAALVSACAGLTGLAGTWGIIQVIAVPDAARIAWTCAAWVTAAALSALASWLAHAAEARFEAQLRRDIGAHLLRMPADRVSKYPADHLRRLVSDDVAALHHTVAHLPGEIATLLIVPLAAAALLFLLAGPMSLLALVPGLLAATAYIAVIPKLSARHGAERARVMGEITTAVDDYARGIRVFRSFGATQGALATYRDATHRFTTGMLSWVRRVATPAAIAVALLQAVASYAIAYAVSAHAAPTILAATLLLSLALVTPALRLGHGLDYVATGQAAGKRIHALLSEPLIPTGSAAPAPHSGGLSATGISVRHGERLLLEPIDIDAPTGSLTAITGPSGAGKSTLLRVLTHLQVPTSGIVRFGGLALNDLSEDARTRSLLLIPQGLDTLAASVRENLRLVNPAADDAACERALKRAQLQVPLDADASVLSGGERQRVSLARAFLSPAKVILLDEPTSALDDATAEPIWTEFIRLAHEEGRTVMIVTHDTAYARRCDRRYTVTAATQVAEGTAA